MMDRRQAIKAAIGGVVGGALIRPEIPSLAMPLSCKFNGAVTNVSLRKFGDVGNEWTSIAVFTYTEFIDGKFVTRKRTWINGKESSE